MRPSRLPGEDGSISEISRRQVLRGLAASVAFVPVSALARTVETVLASGRGLRLAFSTLGCPNWSLTRVLDEAARLGYAAVELRGLEGEWT